MAAAWKGSSAEVIYTWPSGQRFVSYWRCDFLSSFFFYWFLGNFMYFIGYSKWLLLCSRLVAGGTHTHTHKITPIACAVSARVCALWRCNRRMLFPSQVSVQERAPPSLVSWLGAHARRSAPVSSQQSWPVDKLASLSVSFSLFIFPQRGVSFHLSPPPLSPAKYQKVGMVSSLMLSFNSESEAFNKTTEVKAILSPHILCVFIPPPLSSSCLSRAGVQPVPAAVWFQAGALCCQQIYISWGNCIQIISNLRFSESLMNTETVLGSSHSTFMHFFPPLFSSEKNRKRLQWHSGP